MTATNKKGRLGVAAPAGQIPIKENNMTSITDTNVIVYKPGCDMDAISAKNTDRITVVEFRTRFGRLPELWNHYYDDERNEVVVRGVFDGQVEIENRQFERCAVSWCLGHQVREADSYEGLYHRGKDAELLRGLPFDLEITVNRLETKDTIEQISLFLSGEVPLDLISAGLVAQELINAGKRLEAYVAGLTD